MFIFSASFSMQLGLSSLNQEAKQRKFSRQEMGYEYVPDKEPFCQAWT
jgi:hypothetical protein